MSSVTIRVDGLNETIKKLKNKKQDIEKKSKQVILKLANKGIKVARASSKGDSHHFDKMVIFKKEWQGGYICIVGANNKLGGLHTQWYDAEGNLHVETISPILALEYGTAGLAISDGFEDGARGGQGSAGVTFNHIKDTSWYYYTDAKGQHRKYATAEEAKQPMYNAFLEVKSQIKATINEVFGNV